MFYKHYNGINIKQTNSIFIFVKYINGILNFLHNIKMFYKPDVNKLNLKIDRYLFKNLKSSRKFIKRKIYKFYC